MREHFVVCRSAILNEINGRYYAALNEYLRIHGELVQAFFETTVLYEKDSCALVPLTSVLDALCALAQVAEERRYCRPKIYSEGERLALFYLLFSVSFAVHCAGGSFMLQKCRHPLVELWQEDYVPNDVALSAGMLTECAAG